jgi:hypothetical protein
LDKHIFCKDILMTMRDPDMVEYHKQYPASSREGLDSRKMAISLTPSDVDIICRSIIRKFLQCK